MLTLDVDTIIWDLDGTILDSFGIYQDILTQVFKQQGFPEPPEQLLRDHHHGTIEESIRGILADLHLSTDPQLVATIHQAFLVLDNAYIQDVDAHLYEDAIYLAEKAHQAGKRQIIVTNRAHGVNRQNASPRTMIHNSQLKPFIDDIICGDEVSERKPSRQVLVSWFGNELTALGKFVVIGDQFVDAEFAGNLGSDAILVRRAAAIAHLEKLKGWQRYARIVPSLFEVRVG